MTKTLAPRWTIVALAAIVVLALVSTGAATARADATITVHTTEDTTENDCTPTSGICSLREAVELVNEGAVSGSVKIDFSVTGTIETGGNGPLEIEPPASVSTLLIEGPGVADLTLSGKDESEVFYVHKGNVEISGLTVSDGFATWEGGGALYQDGGNVTLAEVALTGNTARHGLNGGAINQNNGNLLIVDSSLTGNHTVSELGGGHGGAIYEDTNSTGTLTLEATQVAGNHAEGHGGGIYEDEGQLSVTRESRVTGNVSEDAGGGIFAEGSGSQARVMIWGGSEIANNEAERGAGIYANVGGIGLVVSRASIVREEYILRTGLPL